MTTTPTLTTMDVRLIAPMERHRTVFATFNALPVGESLDIVSDHDPRPLRQQLDIDMPSTFSWTYLDFGPETWRVRIHKLAQAPARSGCCGHCGGGH